MASGQAGGRLGLLLLVLVALAALGGWNYHRNWKAEEAEQGVRALAGYDTAGLEALAEAYRAEVEQLGRRERTARRGIGSAADTAFIAEGVREFERVQRESRRLREASGELAQREAQLREVEEELRLRHESAVAGLGLHLRRLVGI